MGTTTFSGPVRSGTLKTGETNGPNLGLAVLEQETSITINNTLSNLAPSTRTSTIT